MLHRCLRRWVALLAFAAWSLATPASAFFTFVPSGFTADTVVSGLPLATAVAVAPDGRIFIALKSGVVRVVDANGALLPTSFVDLSASTSLKVIDMFGPTG